MSKNKPVLWMAGSALAMMALVVLLWSPWTKTGVQKGKLTVFCAAGLMKPMTQIARAFEDAFPEVQVVLEPDASGKLLSKIKTLKGKRVDLYLPADTWYLEALEKDGLLAETLPVGHMRPVLAVAPGNPKKISGLLNLGKGDIKLGLADPRASVGRTAKKVFAQLGLWDKLEAESQHQGARVTFLGTVTEAAGQVKLGSVDAAILWKPTAKQFGLDVVPVPEFEQHKIGLTFGVMQSCTKPTLALQFARFASARDKGLPVFEKHHFDPIADGDVWAETPKLTIMHGSMLKPGVGKVFAEFQKREGVILETVANGCGVLVAQMRAGTKPEAYISCDQSFLDMIQDEFEDGILLTHNRLVMVVKKGNPLHLKAPKDLLKGGYKIGVGHPTKSAMGALTQRMLDQLGLYDRIKAANTVIEGDAGHSIVNQFRAGALDVCLVYRSNVQSHAENLQYMDIVPLAVPEALATQPFAIHKKAKHKHLMQRLLNALVSPENERRFKAAGFEWKYKPSEQP